MGTLARLAPAGFPEPRRTVAPTPSAIVAHVLERGLLDRRMVFPEDGSVQVRERWAPPPVGREELAAVEHHLAAMEAYLAPAARGELLGRVLALLSHYRAESLSPDIEMRVADDWAEDLGEFPLWAIEEAARHWRRTKRFRPQICEMVALCRTATASALLARARLRELVAAARLPMRPGRARGVGAEVAEVAGRLSVHAR